MEMTSAKLKTIALITMTIDHIGLVLLSGICGSNLAEYFSSIGIEFNQPLLYIFCRSVGRIAFPIFAFLITEGCIHTRNPQKYLFRLFLFALLSEIPFDLAQFGQINMHNQNVFFTLFFGACMILCFEKLKENLNFFSILYMIAVFLGFTLLSTITFSDYSYKGIIMIALFYFFRKWKFVYFSAIFFQSLKWYFMLGIFASIILIILYNGERGKQNKWVFYLYYPCHLLALYMISNLIIRYL